MEIHIVHSRVLEESDILDPQYAKNNFALQTARSLVSLGDVMIAQFSIIAKSKSLSDLIDKLPHAGVASASLPLFTQEKENIVPLAVLVKSLENSYPFTLQWEFSGCDHFFVQCNKINNEGGWSTVFRNAFSPLGRSSNSTESAPKHERYYNLNTKFWTYNGDRCNCSQLLGFDSAAFRKSTKQSKIADNEYYIISRSYKYFNPLFHAFAHVHAQRKDLRPMLQCSDSVWKVDCQRMEEVLQWIDAECIVDAADLVFNTDNFKVFIQKYDSEGWHILNESDRNIRRDVELAARVAVVLLYRIASSPPLLKTKSTSSSEAMDGSSNHSRVTYSSNTA